MSEITPSTPNSSADRTIERLRSLDQLLDGSLTQVFGKALEMAPHLGGIGIGIVDDPEVTAYFEAGFWSYDSSSVTISTNPHQYEGMLRETTERMDSFRKMFETHGQKLGVAELQMISFAHELGHADHYKRYVQAYHGMSKDACSHYSAEAKEEIASLPLGRMSADAKEAYEANTDGYRDSMVAQGLTGDAWNAVLQANYDAYWNLHHESTADKFAVKVVEAILADT